MTRVAFDGDAIRRERARLGLTQKELAKLAGVTQPAVSQWESGRDPAPALLPVLFKHLAARAELDRMQDELADVRGRLDRLVESLA